MGSTTILPAIELGPLDQIAPRIYVRSIFVFDQGEKYSTAETISHLKLRFETALARWPFLSGRIGPASNSRRPNELELTYDLNAPQINLDQRPDIFAYSSADRLGGLDYQALKNRGMPPSFMDKDILSLTPNHPKLGESCPPVTLKITEVPGGGLFVCFSTHHAIFDGGFIKAFLEYFGRGNDEDPFSAFMDEHRDRPSMVPYTTTDISKATFEEYDFTSNDTVTNAKAISEKPPKAACVLFSIPNKTLSDLHNKALTHVRGKHGDKAFVSKADTLSAMIWVHVTRSRFTHLSQQDQTSFTTAADARPRLSPAFSPGAWGNVYTQTTSGQTTVEDLIRTSTSGTLPCDAVPAILDAAWRVRQAISKASASGYIPARIALASSLPDPTMEGKAFTKALQPGHAGVGCSVWTHMGADVDFGIPGTGGKADYVRKTWSANDGSMNIMQRRGITKGEAPWEVLLALREDDMERICGPNELGRWASTWCA
ncbi:transferase family-domain-containing protein [Colletotrichum godetiae]|uniref:Transferase family-domain-containing protein n=1 Tax=Colletotrichum godetiae TaxID=1209918 RepID=A0AAJ0EX28_9PEZI|nr:transferase family-domain-containing protein [Colletotrichum godetiae]KAK1689425.1 transferase family-domain-containing protein [Colletotrichum godetiae]